MGKTSVSPQILGFANVLAALHKAFQSKTPGESRSLTAAKAAAKAAKIWHI